MKYFPRRLSFARPPTDSGSTGVHPAPVETPEPISFQPSLKVRNGLTNLTPDRTDAEVEIIAIHGLNSNSVECWSAETGSAYWLRDLLAADLPNTAVYTFGYNANIITDASTMRIRHHATTLLQNLRDMRKLHQGRPMIFLCHSLGGIVVKRALVDANNYTDSRYIDILESTYGICFFGTPHRGTDLFDWTDTMGKLIKVSFNNSKSYLVDVLQKQSQELLELAQNFAEVSGQLKIVSFMESRTINCVNKYGKEKNDVIVNEFSAQMANSNEISVHLDKNHRNMCKFSSNNDSEYLNVLPRIKEMVEQALQTIPQRDIIDAFSKAPGERLYIASS